MQSCTTYHSQKFLSTPSARRATVSIVGPRLLVAISIHALREEGDATYAYEPGAAGEFLSTPSARRATRRVLPVSGRSMYFYPRPPRGGRLVSCCTRRGVMSFLSTPSARRATSRPRTAATRSFNFYPRPPRGGRPRQTSKPSRPHYFYPRPPRGGRPACSARLSAGYHFYPRPPRGGRPERSGCGQTCHRFLSTPSARRATGRSCRRRRSHPISIHALREEGDSGRR